MRKILSIGTTAILASLAMAAATESFAQSWPDRPISILTSGAGGSSDISSRRIADGITAALGQPVVVKNSSGQVAIESVANAAPDGYTFLFYGNVIWISPLLQKDASWDAAKSFAPVIMVAKAPNVLTVHPSLPVNSVADLIKLAKDKPGELQFAAAGVGSSTYVAGELFKFMAGVNIERVQYKNTGSALPDVLSGRVPIIFGSPLGIAKYRESGELKAIAVASAKPTELAPGLPTVAATVPGYTSESIEVLMAPAGTPKEIIDKMYKAVADYVSKPEVKKTYADAGVEVVAGTPEELQAEISDQIANIQKAIDAGSMEAK